MLVFTERNLLWSKETAMTTVAYLYGLQYAFLLNGYGRRFLANKISGGAVPNQQYSYPNLTRSFQLPPPIPLSNLTYYRNSDDFGFSLGVSIFLGVTTFALFIISVMFLKCCAIKEPSPKTNGLGVLVLEKINQLFCFSFFYTTCFSIGFWLAQSGIKNLAKAMFYSNETEVEQWQVKFNVDHPGWQLLSTFLILVISIAGMCLLFCTKYAVLETIDPNTINNPDVVITKLMNNMFSILFQKTEDFLGYQMAVVIGYWLSISFIPFLADAMFAHVHTYSDYTPRSRFQAQVAYELVAMIIIAACILTAWICLQLVSNNFLSIVNYIVGDDPRQRRQRKSRELNMDMRFNDFLRFFFPVVHALTWGVLFAYTFLVSGSGAPSSSLYPSSYPGELLLATVIVTAILLIVEVTTYDQRPLRPKYKRVGEEDQDEDVHRSVLLPLLFIIAYPAAYSNSDVFLLWVGQGFGGYVGYPRPSNLDAIGWAQMGLLLAFGAVSLVLFTIVTVTIDCYNNKYS